MSPSESDVEKTRSPLRAASPDFMFGDRRPFSVLSLRSKDPSEPDDPHRSPLIFGLPLLNVEVLLE